MWLKVLWRILCAVVTGKVWRTKTDAELNAERAEELGRLKAEREAYMAECAAEAKKLRTERELAEKQKNHPKPPKRKPKDGMKVFTLLLVLPVFLVGCAAHRPIVATPPSAVCPTIPLPPKPQLPDITIHQEGEWFCFNEEEMTAILQGVDDLKNYSDTLEETVNQYNESVKP